MVKKTVLLFLFFQSIMLSENSEKENTAMLKRIVAFLLSMYLIVPVASADTDKEIVFHGIPWGISVNELVDQLRERNIPSGNINDDYDMRFWGSQFLSITEDHFDSTGYKISIYDYDDKIKIAGHPVLNIDLYAHYGMIDGEISLDADDSQFHFCTIMFAAGDEMIVGVYNDLLSKLNALYGNSTESTFKVGSSNYTASTWYGANNTAVNLYRYISDNQKYQSVNLCYGKTDSEQTLREVRRLVIEHKLQSVADDSTGL